MKYADKQLFRPQCENGIDYGTGLRAVLARRGPRDVLHVAGFKSWGGVGCERDYQLTEIALWFPYARDGHRQEAIHQGRLGRDGFAPLAEKIIGHLGVDFDVRLLSLRHTLLLDEPGEVEGPPKRGPNRKHPRTTAERLYRVQRDPDDEPRMVEYVVDAQQVGKARLTRVGGRGRVEVVRIEHLAREGYAGNRIVAANLFLETLIAERNRRQMAIDEAKADLALAQIRLDETRAKLDLLNRTEV